MYKFSLIIPSYNITEFSNRFFRSMENISSDIDVIFVNDKSTDETESEIKKFINGKENMRLISHVKNKGLGGALNTGIEHMKTNWYFHIDPDDIILPNYEKAISLAINEKVGIIRFKFLYRTEEKMFSPSLLESQYFKMSFGWSCGINVKKFGKPVFREHFKMEDLEMFGRQYRKTGYQEKFINEFLVGYTIDRESSIMNTISNETLKNWKEAYEVYDNNKDLKSWRNKMYKHLLKRRIKKHENNNKLISK